MRIDRREHSRENGAQEMEQAWDGTEAPDRYLGACSFASSPMYLDELLVKPMPGRGSGSLQ